MRKVPDPPKIPKRERELWRSVHQRRKALPRFDYRRAMEGGPMVIYQHCSFVNQAFRDGYDGIDWSKG